MRPAFRVLVLPIKGFTAYYTAFNSSFRVSSETDSMGSPIIYKAKLTWFFVVNFTSAVLEVNTRNMYSFQNLEIWWQSSFVYFQLGFRKIAKASIDEPPLMHWTHLFLISSYDFISCSTKASSLSFSVSISCWSMSSDIFSVRSWLKHESFSWISKCLILSTFRRLGKPSKNYLQFADFCRNQNCPKRPLVVNFAKLN